MRKRTPLTRAFLIETVERHAGIRQDATIWLHSLADGHLAMDKIPGRVHGIERDQHAIWMGRSYCVDQNPGTAGFSAARSVI